MRKHMRQSVGVLRVHKGFGHIVLCRYSTIKVGHKTTYLQRFVQLMHINTMQ